MARMTSPAIVSIFWRYRANMHQIHLLCLHGQGRRKTSNRVERERGMTCSIEPQVGIEPRVNARWIICHARLTYLAHWRVEPLSHIKYVFS